MEHHCSADSAHARPETRCWRRWLLHKSPPVGIKNPSVVHGDKPGFVRNVIRCPPEEEHATVAHACRARAQARGERRCPKIVPIPCVGVQNVRRVGHRVIAVGAARYQQITIVDRRHCARPCRAWAVSCRCLLAHASVIEHDHADCICAQYDDAARHRTRSQMMISPARKR